MDAGSMPLVGFLGSLGTSEIVLVLIVVLIVFGPKRLPDIARTLGKGLRDMRRAAGQIRREVGLDDLDSSPVVRPGPPPRRQTPPAPPAAPAPPADPPPRGAGEPPEPPAAGASGTEPGADPDPGSQGEGQR